MKIKGIIFLCFVSVVLIGILIERTVKFSSSTDEERIYHTALKDFEQRPSSEQQPNSQNGDISGDVEKEEPAIRQEPSDLDLIFQGMGYRGFEDYLSKTKEFLERHRNSREEALSFIDEERRRLERLEKEYSGAARSLSKFREYSRGFDRTDELSEQSQPVSIDRYIDEFDEILDGIEFIERYQLSRLQNPIDIDDLNRLGDIINSHPEVCDHAIELLEDSITQNMTRRRTAIIASLIGTVDSQLKTKALNDVILSPEIDVEVRALALNIRFAVTPVYRYHSISYTMTEDKWILTSPFRLKNSVIQVGSETQGGETNFNPENRDLVISWYNAEPDARFRAEILKFLASWGEGDEVVRNFISAESAVANSEELTLATLSSLDPVRDRARLTTELWTGTDEHARAAARALAKLPADPNSDT
ncbi:MAG: hypothetical protein NUW37_12890, partial [Planctomycetes bacterium]|nr:hypothetical protein [Planctomycetota bacterium]